MKTHRLWGLGTVITLLGLAGCISVGEPSSVPPSDLTPLAISTARGDPLAALTGTPAIAQLATGSPFYAVTLDNQSDYSVCYVYISASVDKNWGSDWLDLSTVITAGDTFIFNVKEGEYDLRAENCDHMRLDERYNVTLSDNWSWEVPAETPIYWDSFDDGIKPEWQLPAAAAGKAEGVDQVLQLTANGSQAPALAVYNSPVMDAILVVEVKAGQATGIAAYGAACRVQPNGDAYLFLVRSDKQVSIQHLAGGKMTALSDWQAAPDADFINDPNVVEIQCKGSQLALRLNGLTVVKAEDAALSEGQFGLVVVSLVGGPADYRFDNLVMIAP